MAELKPCPFCLSKNVEVIDKGPTKGYAVLCFSCESEGPEAGSHQQASDAWNMRHEHAPANT